MDDQADDSQLQAMMLERFRDHADADAQLVQIRTLMSDLRKLFLYYEFGIDEVRTKVEILRKEFERIHEYSPIEHVRGRLKSHESVFKKALNRGCALSVDSIRAEITDIAGIRITCSFVSDVYWMAEMLSKQPDVTVLEVKDYIANPKPNGYRSLHLIVQVPVFLSTHTEQITVELQIRTIAMDFWASIEHKLRYKYDSDMPQELADQIADTARVATELDARMGALRDEVRPSPNGVGGHGGVSASGG